MNNTRVLLASQISTLILAVTCCMPVVSTPAQEVQHLTVTRPGGFPGLPVMSGIQRTTNGVAVTWDGPSGYYQLYQKFGLTNKTWQTVGSPNLTRKATITTLTSNAFFKVQGPSPRYAGAATCAECHDSIHATETQTRHAGAFTNTLFVAQGGQTNSSCLPCHTVGYGLPTGFVSKNDPNTNPRLAGVQCESCHGPAAAHAANEMDFTVRPRVELAGQVCGGCHNTKFVPASVAQYHPPYFEDWSVSAHSEVRPDLKEDFEGSRGPTVYIPTCGRCHSGSVREAHLENQPLPDGSEAAAVGITCGICHDPHEVQRHTNTVTGISYTNQLRNPLSSLQDYHTTGDFSTNYNKDINVCAQCHNDRGASWSDSSRPPHHSPQYNMLLGTVGELTNGPATFNPAAHAGLPSSAQYSFSGTFYLTNQCVSCHMQGDPAPANTHSHTFTVGGRYDVCMNCHVIFPGFDPVQDLAAPTFLNSVNEVKGMLDVWATTNAPVEWQAKYGTRAWEYATPGELSPGGSGPTSDEQDALLQQEEAARSQCYTNCSSLVDFRQIQKARFNLYLAVYDGSYGIHNLSHTFALLESAKQWVKDELKKKQPAQNDQKRKADP